MDWASTWSSFGAALLGALVGGGIAFKATQNAMKHEAALRRDERLRALRAEMVQELAPVMSALEFGDPTERWKWQTLGVAADIARLSYSGTQTDRDKAIALTKAVRDFMTANEELMREHADFNTETGRYEFPPDQVAVVESLFKVLRDAADELDQHLLDVLEESDSDSTS